MFRMTLFATAACMFLAAWPDAAHAQRWRGGRGVYIRTPGVSVGVGNYGYGGYRGYYPTYYNRGWYGHNASPYWNNYGYYRYPSIGVYTGYPVYSSGYVAGPVYYSNEYVAQTPGNVTTISNYADPNMVDTTVHVTVILPDANARLMVQDRLNQSVGTERHIVSPPLNINTQYHYTFRATWTDSNGQEVTREKRIEVKPGQRYTVDFNQP